MNTVAMQIQIDPERPAVALGDVSLEQVEAMIAELESVKRVLVTQHESPHEEPDAHA